MPSMPRVEQIFCRSVVWRRFTRSVVLPWALQGRPVSGRVLEVGAGSGAMAAAIASRHHGCELTITDYDTAMVDRAAEDLHGHPAVEVRQADATLLPFEDRSFDTVLSFIMLHHVGRWEDAIAEAARVLKPGGTFLGYDLVDTPVTRVIHRLEGAQHLTRLVTPSQLRSVLRSDRFRDAEVQVSRLGLLMTFQATRAD